MTYNVGDRVQVRSEKEIKSMRDMNTDGRIGGLYWNPKMYAYCEMIGVISKRTSGNAYTIEGFCDKDYPDDDSEWRFNSAMLQPAKPTTNYENQEDQNVKDRMKLAQEFQEELL